MDIRDLLIIVAGSFILGVIALVYVRRFQVIAERHAQVIEEERGKLLAMIASLADGVMMVGPNLELVVANRVLPQILSVAEIRSFSDVTLAVGKKADVEGAIKQSMSGQVMVRLQEFSLGDRVIQVDVEPVKNKQGQLLGVAVVFHDVSEAKKLEKLREDFTAMMVHELRTPLTTISYSTGMILSDFAKLSPEELTAGIKVINSTVVSMLDLVNELLDVAKIEAGKIQVVKEKGDLRSLIEEKVVSFEPFAGKKNLKLVTSIDPSLPGISFDRRRIGQVMNNLLSNAVKYTDSGQIVVGVKVLDGVVPSPVGRQIIVWVADSGEGISQEDLPKLFSKFEQLGKGKTGEQVGTGLGLVVAKGIIEAHGGKIWAYSEGLGRGTTFTFTLPLAS